MAQRYSYPAMGPIYAQRTANTQAEIAARAEAARLLAQQKADFADKDAEAKAKSDAANNVANWTLHQSQTNAAWNKQLADIAQKNRPKPIKVTEQERNDKGELTGRTFVREVDPAVLKAEEKAKKILELTTKRDLLKNEWRMPFGLSSVPAKLAAVDREIAAVNAPTDLLSAPKPGAAPVAAAPVPTPRGFIGSAGRNTFLAEPSPLGMSRAETNAYAINLNNQASPPPRDLLRSESFPQGYDPAHGSFQVETPPPSERGYSLLENPATAPVPQDAPMADFNGIPEDAPMAPFKADARPRIPKSHIEHLIKNPDAAKDFNAKYGDGTAEEILNR